VIVVLCRNNLALTQSCVRTLKAQTVEILAINNASTDGTAAWLKAQRGFWNLSFREPRSVAQSWNAGLNWVFRFVDFAEALVVNNDTELLHKTYQLLRNRLQKGDCGLVTCVSVRDRAQLILPNEPIESANPDYSCFMISRETFRRVPFDENFAGAFCEDCDHHVRLHRAGIRAINTGIPFLHHGSMTIKMCPREEAEAIKRQAEANREYFYRKWGRRIGTRGYDDLFSEETFGVDQRVTV
jgi:glycosyltransferase involved in cell wall biosynthesis